MITVAANDSKNAFEKLLEATASTLEEAIRIAPPMGNFELEDSVLRAMREKSVNTPFHGMIEKTERGEFPDIVANSIYGVEVKQVQKNSSRTRGNSIFETTRVPNVKQVYLMMCWDAAGGGRIKWRKYEEAIADVVITHSSRYLIDAELPEGQSLFDQLEISYDTFRNLEQNEMMSHVRKLYQQNDDSKDLWWLETRDRKPLRTLESLNDEERYKLIAEAFFLCPCVFGEDSRHKFTPVVAYFLSQGVVSQVIRDKFSSGGRNYINGIEVAQMLYRAGVRHKDEIINASSYLDDELICQFWEIKNPPSNDNRIKEWLFQIRKHYRQSLEELIAFEAVFKV